MEVSKKTPLFFLGLIMSCFTSGISDANQPGQSGRAHTRQIPAMWDWLKRAVVKKAVRAGVEKNLRAAEAHVGAVNKPEQGALLHVASIA